MKITCFCPIPVQKATFLQEKCYRYDLPRILKLNQFLALRSGSSRRSLDSFTFSFRKDGQSASPSNPTKGSSCSSACKEGWSAAPARAAASSKSLDSARSGELDTCPHPVHCTFSRSSSVCHRCNKSMKTAAAPGEASSRKDVSVKLGRLTYALLRLRDLAL